MSERHEFDSVKDHGGSGTTALVWEQQVRALLERVSQNEIDVHEKLAPKLVDYCLAVAEWSERAGLVSPKDLPLLVSKHIGASLGPLMVERAKAGDRWVDVGAGAGLPGFVIKLCRPELDMTLVDSSRKKTVFLEWARNKLDVQGLAIIEARIESLHLHGLDREEPESGEGADRRQVFDVVLMRAVAPLRRAIPLLSRITAKGSRLLTFKGPSWQSELREAEEVLSREGWAFDSATQIPWAMPKILRFTREL